MDLSSVQSDIKDYERGKPQMNCSSFTDPHYRNCAIQLPRRTGKKEVKDRKRILRLKREMRSKS